MFQLSDPVGELSVAVIAVSVVGAVVLLILVIVLLILLRRRLARRKYRDTAEGGHLELGTRNNVTINDFTEQTQAMRTLTFISKKCKLFENKSSIESKSNCTGVRST